MHNLVETLYIDLEQFVDDIFNVVEQILSSLISLLDQCSNIPNSHQQLNNIYTIITIITIVTNARQCCLKISKFNKSSIWVFVAFYLLKKPNICASAKPPSHCQLFKMRLVSSDLKWLTGGFSFLSLCPPHCALRKIVLAVERLFF